MTTGNRLRTLLLSCALLASFAGCGDQPLPASFPEEENVSMSFADHSTAQASPAVIVDAEETEATLVESASSKTASVTHLYREQILEKHRENSSTIGWLYIPDTTVDTAIVQNPYSNNNYYLQHSFYGSTDPTGTYCADFRCFFGSGSSKDLSTNTILYAHSFDDDPQGTLFSQLKNYRDSTFARSHPYIYFSTAEEDMAWEVFAVYDTTVEFPYVWPELPSDTYREVLDVVKRSSLYDYGIEITAQDKILTLSTCTFLINGQSLPLDRENDYRFVIMARLVQPGETFKERASLTVNRSPLQPDDQPLLDLSWIENWES